MTWLSAVQAASDALNTLRVDQSAPKSNRKGS